MMNTCRINILLSLVIGGAAATVAALALAQSNDDVRVIDQPVGHDAYVARREIEVRSTIDGDLVAAGQRVTVDGAVSGDILVAAQNIEILSAVSDDVRAAGQHVRVRSPVSGHIVAAGQTVTVSEQVSDWAWLAGDTVEVLGDVDGGVKIRAREITINSEISGDVDLIGDELRLEPNAVVHGELRWRGENEAEISPDAQIYGEFIEEPLPGIAEEISTGRGLSFTLSAVVAVMALFLLFSRPLRASTDRIAARPVVSLVLGFAISVALPVLALLLIFSPLDAWIGLGVLGIFLVVLLLSVLTGLFAISDLALRKFRPSPNVWQSLAAIFLSVVAVAFLAKIPWLGVVLVIAIWLTGIGALCWNSWVTLRNGRHYKPQPSKLAVSA